MKTNYDILMECEIKKLAGRRPKLLLHSCCGPCSTSVIERLQPYFEITVFYYNPNIYPELEYERRKNEQIGYLDKIGIDLLLGDYSQKEYFDRIKGLEDEREGGLRCAECFLQRLEKTAYEAINGGYEYFCTTLSVSKHKNSILINEAGIEAENHNQRKVKFLRADFKKKDGYKRSLELCRKEDMYRQEYCGCIYSKEKLKQK